MSLHRALHLAAILLVLAAAMPLLPAEELPRSLWLASGGGLLVSLLLGRRTWPRPLIVALTTALIAGFVLLLLDSLASGQWLVNAISFALLATVARSLQVPTSRQVFQLIALSFLVLISAAVANPDLSFAAWFVAYMILLTWSLTFAHIQQLVEEAGESPAAALKASVFVSGRFLAASSLLAVALLLTSMVIFFLFPRLGLGFFSAQTRRGDPVSGFADTIELGHFGTLQMSTRVALRLEIISGREYIDRPSALRLRGLSFDHYDGRGWSRSDSPTYPLRSGSDGYSRIWANPTAPDIRYDMVEMDVYQEPLDTESKVLFGLVRPLAIRRVASRFDHFRGTTRNFWIDDFGDLSYTGPEHTSMSYSVQSGLLDVAPSRLQNLPFRIPRWVLAYYLQLPEKLDPRIRQLAEQVVHDASTIYGATAAVESYLQNSFRYTREGAGLPEDPLAAFLFEGRAGHCEYFATAMVVMLRTLGIPARIVNGFLGGTYNEFGDYYSVSEGNAHSWVEVYFAKFGWITFDPTPPEERLPVDESTLITAMEQWFDALKLKWYKWVVEYDLERQIQVYAGLWNLLSSEQNQLQLSPGLSLHQMRKEAEKIGRTIFSARTALILAALALLAAAAAVAARVLRRRRAPGPSTLDRLALRLRTALRRKGLTVPPGATLPALARQAAARGFAAADDLDLLVARLEAARWSSASQADLQALRSLLSRIHRAPILARRP